MTTLLDGEVVVFYPWAPLTPALGSDAATWAQLYGTHQPATVARRNLRHRLSARAARTAACRRASPSSSQRAALTDRPAKFVFG
jgi:hypothetical protein